MKLKNFILSAVILGGLFLIVNQTFAISGDYGLTDTVNQTSLPKDIAGQTNIVGMAGVLIKAALSLVGLFFFGLMLYAGIVWMKSMGAGDDVTRAKDIIQAAIIGLIIVTASYAITSFVFTSLGATAGSGNGNAGGVVVTYSDGDTCTTTAITANGFWNCGSGTKSGSKCTGGSCQLACTYHGGVCADTCGAKTENNQSGSKASCGAQTCCK